MGLLCTAGMLNGVFGDGELRHVANWQSRKYTSIWTEEDDEQKTRHIREYFSHECALLWSNGLTQVLTHEPPDTKPEQEPDQAAEPEPDPDPPRKPNVLVMPGRNPSHNGHGG